MRRRRGGDTGNAKGKMMEDRPQEFADIDPAYRTMTRADLERSALVIAPGTSGDQGRSIARAKAELVLRDRDYAEEQERSRREFEREMSAAADAREARRQKFDEELMQRQMDHASKLAREQLATAQGAEKAAKWAAWAAGTAALGAIGQVIVAIVK